MEFEVQPGMPGGDQIVVDGLRWMRGVARTYMALQTSTRSLVEVFSIEEAWGVSSEIRLIMSVHPTTRRAMTRFALHAERVMDGLGRRIGRRRRRVTANAALVERLGMLGIC